jgi:hypothetical protein
MKMKSLCFFKTSGRPNPVTQCYIPDVLNPEVYTSWTTLKMAPASLLETLVFIYHSTQSHVPKDFNLQCSGHFSLKTPVAFTGISIVVQCAGLLQVTALFQVHYA